MWRNAVADTGPIEGPLTGMRVIDLSHVLAGPVCAMFLADLGADVIKVEKPEGDDSRRMVPPEIGGESAAFMIANRNKRGIVIDLKTDEGKDTLRRLLRSADVLVENFAPGALDRLGFGGASLSSMNPALIHCSITGFGLTGPRKDMRGFDLIAQAMSGIMSFTGDAESGAPTKCGPPVSDITAGLLAAIGVISAYVHRLKTGEGQRVDTSLFEAALTQTYWQSAIALATGSAPRPLGSRHPLSAPYQAFRTMDGWIVVGGANQSNWLRLVEALGIPEIARDGRFADNAARMRNLDALEPALSAQFLKKSTAEWLAAFDRIGMPCAPVLDMVEALNDPQTVAREMVVEIEHSRAGKVRALGVPIKFSRTAARVRRAAPALAEHAAEILAELEATPEGTHVPADAKAVRRN